MCLPRGRHAYTVALVTLVLITAAAPVAYSQEPQVVISSPAKYMYVVWPNVANTTTFLLSEGKWVVWTRADLFMSFGNGTTLRLQAGTHSIYVEGVRVVRVRIGKTLLTIKVLTRSEAQEREAGLEAILPPATISDVMFGFSLGLVEGLLFLPLIILAKAVKEKREGDAYVA